jgi:hypothetical protein
MPASYSSKILFLRGEIEFLIFLMVDSPLLILPIESRGNIQSVVRITHGAYDSPMVNLTAKSFQPFFEI